MTAPRVDIDVTKIRHNTHVLHSRLKGQGINVTGVTKAVCGHPAIAQAMLDGGAAGLADARSANVDRLRAAGISCHISMIRTPMQSQVKQIIKTCNTSYNTEIEVIAEIARAARNAQLVHNIILMVEMGDGREGIMPGQLNDAALQVHALKGVELSGIGANFACLSGVPPSNHEMSKLSAMAAEVESICGTRLTTISGGNSANLPLFHGEPPHRHQLSRINDLRIGEAILLGVDPLSGCQIDGLYTDAFQLIAEVIEAKTKPEPTRHAANHMLAFAKPLPQDSSTLRFILALGQQDTDISGLTPPKTVSFLGSTSDHVMLATPDPNIGVGSELSFQLNYAALMRLMSAPDVLKVLHN